MTARTASALIALACLCLGLPAGAAGRQPAKHHKPNFHKSERIEPYSKHPSELEPYRVCPPPTEVRPSCTAIGAPSPRKRREAGLPVPLLEGSGENKGFSPEDLRDAYGLPSEGGKGVTVAVTAYGDDPKAWEDLAVYRERYELPALPRCSEAEEGEACFSKVNQEGEEANYPAASKNWAEETSLDLDMVSATCPNATSSWSRPAASPTCPSPWKRPSPWEPTWSATVGPGGESPAPIRTTTMYFDHPGTPILFASGDDGYGVKYPAASPDTIAVGGTSLYKTKARAAGPRAPGTAPAAAAAPTRKSRPGRATKAAKGAPSPTSPPSPIPARPSRSTTATNRPTRGRTSAAPAPPPRSWPASRRSPKRASAQRGRAPFTASAEPAASSTPRKAPTASAPATCARPGRAMTGRPAGAHPTARSRCRSPSPKRRASTPKARRPCTARLTPRALKPNTASNTGRAPPTAPACRSPTSRSARATNTSKSSSRSKGCRATPLTTTE